MFDGIGKYIPLPIKDIYISIRLKLENNIINFSDNEDISKITDNIFIGNISTGTNKQLLLEKGITHIVSVLSDFDPPYADVFDYHFVEAYDIEEDPIILKFQNSNTFITNAIDNGGKVYIHCMSGRSRSVTIAVAYFMSKENVETDNLLEIIRNKRDIICPNKGFIKQLDTYYDSLHNTDNEYIV
jgi:protein-tyrosine phosphatase